MIHPKLQPNTLWIHRNNEELVLVHKIETEVHGFKSSTPYEIAQMVTYLNDDGQEFKSSAHVFEQQYKFWEGNVL